MSGATNPPTDHQLQVSSREPEQLRARLEQWLHAQLPAGTNPVVRDISSTSATGMSSDTVLFSTSWTEAGTTTEHPMVARIAPDEADVPVFPDYDLERQYRVMQLVGELTSVPVPKVWWLEPSSDAVGAPFFVMSRVDGQVPPDVMPYTFGDNWLYDATPDQQRTLQQSTVEAIAELHGIDGSDERFAFLQYDAPGHTPLHRHVANAERWYEYARDGHRSPLVERGFAWLHDHWPSTEGEAVVSWGDARIGNVLYRDFRPAAVLDWEMAAIGPAELDVAWLVNAHLVFETLARSFDLPGMPDFLRPADVVDAYERLTGRTLADLDWFITYACVQWGIVFLRTGLRAVHFGEREMPADLDDLHHHRPLVERLLAGWSPTAAS